MVVTASEHIRAWGIGQLGMTEAETGSGRYDLTVCISHGFGEASKSEDVSIRKADHKMMYERSDYFISINGQFTTAYISVFDSNALKHAMLHLYSSFLIHYLGGLLLHGSCVLRHGQVHAYAGRTGDVMLVRLTGKEALVYVPESEKSPLQSSFTSADGRAAQQDLHPAKPAEGDPLWIPLAAIHFIFPAAGGWHSNHENRSELLEKPEMITYIMEHLLSRPHGHDATGKASRLAKKLADGVSGFRLPVHREAGSRTLLEPIR
ncbi:hypothetical protein [Paenibacillus sp. y28]|uniref:hypothetical protein n=1 Tax=Paenibacillus sp. y28 TaxID=3129110 RepID=UPI003019684C